MKAIVLCFLTSFAGALDCLNEEMAQESLPESLPEARDECLLSCYVQFRTTLLFLCTLENLNGQTHTTKQLSCL